jgi:hypothetical protein
MQWLHTYELEPGPESRSFEAYAAETEAEYRALLDAGGPEATFQRFLERNPCFVPGTWSPGTPSGHVPLHYSLISQPELPGLRSRIPDFMWIASDSARWYPMLIEVERPDKRVFRKDGVPTAEFTQARNQLAQWRAWLSDPTNVLKFVADYGIPNDFVRHRVMEPHFILVYGRRAEFETDPERSKHRAALMPSPDETLVSFDRLRADANVWNAITVRATGNGRFSALSVMPTFSTGPIHAKRLLHIEGLEEVVLAEDRMSEPRRAFLARRLAYWRTWAAEPEPSVINSRDHE